MGSQKSGINNSNYKHGYSSTRTYSRWRGMISRCYDSGNTAYRKYGGRGITVCERWRDFRNFLEDMGPCPEGLTLDRFRNSENYNPSNCRWTTPKEQTKNRRNTRFLVFNGQCKTISEWSEITGISYKSIRSRLNYKWSVKRVLTEPVRKI